MSFFGRNSGGGGGQRPPPGGGPPPQRGPYDRVPSHEQDRYGGGGGDRYGGGGGDRYGGGGGGNYGRGPPPPPPDDEKAGYRQQGLPSGPGPRGQGGGMPPRRPVGGGGGGYGGGGGGGGGGPPGGGQTWQLRPAKSPSNDFTFGNIVAVSPQDFGQFNDGSDFYILIQDRFVLTARMSNVMPPGQMSLSDAQRTWASISLQDMVNVRMYDPFSEGSNCYLGAVDAEVGFAGRKSTPEQIDQDELAQHFSRNYQNQLFAPGQRILMDFKSLPMLFVIKTVTLGDLSMDKGQSGASLSDPMARGILMQGTDMTFYKDAKSGINLKASKKRPAANAILQPNFKFEDMGIGGLEAEFGTIFRRAFASRIFPPGLIQNMGIQHVKGILMYGPPGTGKTLIARKIGQMLNAREPKVINGPEVLNKFVGQSEENIRKLFADAEKEYKEKGEESGLHIIIFDELDAVCKQRGSGAGGGTGVGDSVVNQLLSKLDGVDQLNNILLIGMTNRKDMIDDALLRPGRLEVHMEISLPDENGRVQILGIHTAQMRKHGNLDPDVDIKELARLTKNFSGAEISGLVRSATSFALNRHVKVGTMAALGDDIENMTVNREDFDHALDDVKPAFGVSEDELQNCIKVGIMHFSPYIQNILEDGNRLVRQVQQDQRVRCRSALLHGPRGCGKTALAAKIALDSGYPFIKLCSPKDMVGFNEAMKIDHMRRIFEDAYKSSLSVVVIDDIERILGWVPIGPRFDNSVLNALQVLVSKDPPRDRRLLILATSAEHSALLQLNLLGAFGQEIAIPNVRTYEELGYILQQSGSFEDPRRAISELQDLTRKDGVNVGIKTCLESIGAAQQDSDDVYGAYAQIIQGAMTRQGFA